MAAPKARFQKSHVHHYNSTFDVIWLNDGMSYPLADMPGPELRTACAALFGDANQPYATKDQRLAAIRNNDPSLMLPDAVTPTADPLPIAPPTTTPTENPTMPTTDATAAELAALLAKLMASPTMDEDAVRQVARDTFTDHGQYIIDNLASNVADQVDVALQRIPEAIDTALAALRPTVVTVGERPTVTIQGTPHKMLETVLRIVQCGNVPYLVGPAGTGKSTLARQVAESLGRRCYTVALGPTDGAHRISGYKDGHGNYVRTDPREAVEHGHVLLVDEIDGGNPGVMKGAINELAAAKPGDLVSFPDGMVQVHENFVLMVAANTFGHGASREYVGAAQLDASTIDRFDFVPVDYDEDLERNLAAAIAGNDGTAWAAKVHAIRANQRKHALRVIVSTRAVEKGARRIAAGFTTKEAFYGAIGLAHDETTVAKLTEGVALV